MAARDSFERRMQMTLVHQLVDFNAAYIFVGNLLRNDNLFSFFSDMCFIAEVSPGFVHYPVVVAGAPNYVQFATYGYAVAHEITHGYDSIGVQHVYFVALN